MATCPIQDRNVTAVKSIHRVALATAAKGLRKLADSAKAARYIFAMQGSWVHPVLADVSRRKTASPPHAGGYDCEICILAGGLSRRMGREKSKLKLGKRTMLGHIRATAKATGLPVRVIRRDSVPRCGPLGGIYTALKSTPAATVLFLSCDMPLVSVELLQKLLKTKAEAVLGQAVAS